MNTKILVGSIGAVVILILVSFTNVVGVQSTTSSSKKESPLFNVRLKRAINEGSKDILTSDYLGKGAEIIISFPPRDNQIYLFQEIIDKIREMNDREFSAFKQIIIRYLIKEKLIQYKNGSRVVYLFNQIEYNTDEINQYIAKRTKDPPTRIEYCWTVPGAWNTCQSSNECHLYQLKLVLIFLLIFATMFIIITVGEFVNSISWLLGKLTIKVCE